MLLLANFANANQCAHTWHDVVSNHGSWEVTLQVISQVGHGALVDKNCQPMTKGEINPTKLIQYGLTFDEQADFNIAYTLTAVEKGQGFDRKACVFVVTANKPADPDIRVSSFHGASCDWYVVPGVGENFSVA